MVNYSPSFSPSLPRHAGDRHDPDGPAYGVRLYRRAACHVFQPRVPTEMRLREAAESVGQKAIVICTLPAAETTGYAPCRSWKSGEQRMRDTCDGLDPPDLQDATVQNVLQQAEALSASWAA